MTKVCNTCGESKPISEFGKDKYKSDGYSNQCKLCRASQRPSRAGCQKARAQWESWYEKNKESLLSRQKRCPKKREYARRRYQSRKKEILKQVADYSKTPKAKALKCARESGRRARQSFPLTKEQREEVNNFYWLAQDLKKVTGEDYHVDHIIPLRGRNVSGLHVPWNLQVLPADINLSKSNKIGE